MPPVKRFPIKAPRILSAEKCLLCGLQCKPLPSVRGVRETQLCTALFRDFRFRRFNQLRDFRNILILFYH